MNVPYRDLTWEYRQVRDAVDLALRRVASSGRYLIGPELEQFEHGFAAYVGARHCVGLGSGTDALRLTLAAWHIGWGDEVIVPAHTAVATWLAVAQTGATPVQVCVDPATFNVDASRIEAAVSSRTRAIVPVHLYGQPADMGPITDIARRCGLLVLEDAAQAHGARYLGRRLGTFGDAAAWSFYPTKNLGAFGDAGAVTTDDGELAGRLRALRHPRAEGSDRSRVAACSSRLDEIQAAILGAKLTFLDDWNNRRRRIAARYRGALADVEATMPAVAPWAEPVWHAFVVRSRARDRLQRHLATAGVATAVHYPKPPAEHACFSMPNDGNEGANRLAKEVLSLPIGPELDDDQLEHVVASMCAFDA